MNMRSFSLGIFVVQLLFLFSAFGQHRHWWEGSQVLELTASNFYEYVGKDKFVVVEFFTPWCGYCRNMAAEYEALREMYNGPSPKRSDVVIARINGNEHQQMTMRYNIYAYPAILFFPKGQREYSQSFEIPYRTREYFSRWIEELAGPEPKAEVKVEEKKEEEKKVEEVKPEPASDQNLRSQQKQTEEKVENEAKAENAEKPIENPVEQKNLTVAEQVHKIHDILVTLSDKINYIENENSKKLNEAIKSIEQLEAASINLPANNNRFLSRNGVIFLLIGFVFGVFLALCLMKFRNIGHNHPALKTV